MIAYYTSCFFLFINDNLKLIPYFFGTVVSLSINPVSAKAIIFKMIVTGVSLLVGQIFTHYMKPIIIKKINRCKKKIQNKKDELHKS